MSFSGSHFSGVMSRGNHDSSCLLRSLLWCRVTRQKPIGSQGSAAFFVKTTIGKEIFCSLGSLDGVDIGKTSAIWTMGE